MLLSKSKCVWSGRWGAFQPQCNFHTEHIWDSLEADVTRVRDSYFWFGHLKCPLVFSYTFAPLCFLHLLWTWMSWNTLFVVRGGKLRGKEGESLCGFSVFVCVCVFFLLKAVAGLFHQLRLGVQSGSGLDPPTLLCLFPPWTPKQA